MSQGYPDTALSPQPGDLRKQAPPGFIALSMKWC